ncbi:MAG: glycosyltransferase family 2 protein [Elusimicrobiaceae bacterium]|nr:glycosyltransferase family 2 protein [Elusimicrobiaceae bacterium]
MPRSQLISIIIPVYNEQANIAALAAEIAAVAENSRLNCEAVWTDDGSSDDSYAEITAACRKYPFMRGIRFGRNCGQTAAIAAGISDSHGELIVLLDADGQNDPADIPALLRALDRDTDIVSGWRKTRRDNAITRTLPSRIANALISGITGVRLHDYGCTLKLYRARFLKELRLYGEMHRFMPALAGALGARIKEIEVNHRPRINGDSKYGLERTFKVLLDLATVKFMGRYLSNPIYLFGGTGLALGGLAAALAAVTLYKKYHLGIFVKDQPLFAVAIFLGIVSVQVLLLGLLSEVISRTYFEINSRAPYFVRERTQEPDHEKC